MKTIFFAIIAVAFAAIISSGCKTTTSLPPMDLSAPGWHVQHGQAIWTPPKNGKEIAGDLILATNESGNCFIQFSKTPFTIATAEVQDMQWEIQFGADKYAWRGGGAPPDRFIWFQLPPALRGEDLIDDWKFERSSGNLWRLTNPKTGETLSGQFFQ